MAEGATIVTGRFIFDPGWAVPFPNQIFAHLRRDPGFVICQRVPSPPGESGQDGLRLDQLVSRARHWMRLFEDHGLARGDRVVFSLSDPHAVLSGMLGAMMAGVVAVPLQTAVEFRTAELFRARMTAVVGDCSPGLIVTERLDRWRAAMGGVELGAPVVELDAGGPSEGGLPSVEDLPEVEGDQPVLIQYTSGSTGEPRGVVITHANLAANLAAIGLAIGAHPADRLVYWLPLHHDMGLIGCLLFSAYWRIASCVLSPMQFFTRPVSWLEAIGRFRATLTVAPLFAFGLCLRKLPDKQLESLDLRNLRLALCGAEPIDPAVVARFNERFARCGFKPEAFFPVYGLAEATLAVAFPEPGEQVVVDRIDRELLASRNQARPCRGDRGATRFVSVGRAVPGHRLWIADPSTGRRLAEREVGEIRVAGPSISPGYHGETASAPSGGRDLATGDLGYLADGRLYVVDRLKDLIIIAGQNFAPSDVESCLADVPGVRAGRAIAFAIRGDAATEVLVIAAEVDRRSWRTQVRIAGDIVTAVRKRMGLEVERVVLLPPGALQRTTSGKLKRRACRDDFLAGRWAGRLSLRQRLAAKLAPARLLLVRLAGQD